jgi:SNF2 family DNA or RNA helicase
MPHPIYENILYPYQKEAAKRIVEQRKVLLADQPGLGKTLEALGALELDGLFDKPSNILILTPIINAQTTWLDSIVKWVLPNYPSINLIDASKGTVNQKLAKFKGTGKHNIVLANHNAIDYGVNGMRVKTILDYTYDAVIVDESHLVLPMTSKKLTNFREGLHRVSFKTDAIRLAISGTPDRGKLENRYGTWMFLGATKSNKWQWQEENFYISERQVSRTRTVKMIGELKNRQAWLAKDKAMMIRRTKHEVLPQLPAKRYVDVEIELHEEQKLDYFIQQLVSERKMAKSAEENKQSGEPMVFALRARQITSCQWSDNEVPTPLIGKKSAKLDWLLEWLDERGFIYHDDFTDNTAKVVIVSQFSAVLRWLKAELTNAKIDCDILDGSVSQAKRDAIQKEFQDGDLRVVLLSGQMGVGINLDKADDLIMLDSPYDPDRIEQIEDRVHRASNMHQVTIWNLIAVDSIDQAIAETVNKRYQTTRQLIDGARGVDFARQILATITKENADELL